MHIGIIGAGFTGCMLAVHLLRAARGRIALTLIEKGAADPDAQSGGEIGARVGRGLAYGTDNPDHLLNVRAAGMSAFADDPGHFAAWLAQGGAASPSVAQAFASRRRYGDYIHDTFASAARTYANAGVTVVAGQAVRLEDGARPALTLADGRRLAFDAVALCIGNFPPAVPSGASAAARASGRILGGPWNGADMRRIGPDDAVMILGSGLSMADTVQTLSGQGHRAPIRAVSRHGFLPARHAAERSYDMPPLPRSLAGLVRAVRREARAAEREGYVWQDAVDALRTVTAGLWQGFTLAEKRRFLRHVRPYWDVHRHRLAPPVADEIDALRRAGRLAVEAGHIGRIDWDGARFDVAVHPRGSAVAAHAAPAWIVNCTGPHSDYARSDDPLIRDALSRGVLRPDPLALGLDVTRDNMAVGADGAASARIAILGPPTRYAFWEITAVPDIRLDCARVADFLVARLAAAAAE